MVRPRAWFALLAAALVGGAALLAARAPLGGDYPGPTCDTCDYPGPSIAALAHGDLHGFFAQQPVMGSASLLLRAPAAALVHGELWQYRVGALLCLLVLVGVALLLAGAMAQRGRSWALQALVAGLAVCGPLTAQALRWGHPEELMGAGLCVAAVLLAGRGRAAAAGVVLGIALATKPWAMFAIVPVLMVAGRGRVRLAAWGVGVAAALTLPMLLGDPHRFFALTGAFGGGGTGVTPSNVWWGYGHQAAVELTPHGDGTAYAIPAWVGHLAHPLVIVLGFGAPLVAWWRRPGRDVRDALGVLALVFLARCLFDTLTYGYHHAPFVVALAAYEGLRRRGLPWASIAVAGAVWAMNEIVAPVGDPNLLNRVYLAWALPVAGWLVVQVFFPDLLARRRSVESAA